MMLGWLKADARFKSHEAAQEFSPGWSHKAEPWGKMGPVSARRRGGKECKERSRPVLLGAARCAPTSEWFRCALRDLGSTRARRLSLLFRQVA
jgi:hypothetical protein